MLQSAWWIARVIILFRINHISFVLEGNCILSTEPKRVGETVNNFFVSSSTD